MTDGSRKMKEERISPIAAILVIILTFTISIITGIIIYLAYLVINLRLSVELPPIINAFVMVVGELMFFIVPFTFMLLKGINVKKYIKVGDTKLKGLLLGIGLGLVLLVMDLFLTLALTYVLGESQVVKEANETVIELATHSTTSLALLTLALSLAGLCEEFAFRGFLQNALESRYPSPIAIIGAALAFGLAHFDPQAVYSIVGFAHGLVLGYVYAKLKSYVSVASAHVMINLASLALFLLLT
jgi:membrane protease YdiL (CAAX protease family)